MVITGSRRRRPGAERSTSVTRTGLRALKERAKNPADRLELVIVRDMWLTGLRLAVAAHHVRGQAHARRRA